MIPRAPISGFLVAAPFELLDLIGPAAVFAYPKVKNKPYYSFRILSAESGEMVKSMGGLSIADTSRFSDYTGRIDTLVRRVGGAIGRRLEVARLEFRGIVRRSVRIESVFRIEHIERGNRRSVGRIVLVDHRRVEAAQGVDRIPGMSVDEQNAVGGIKAGQIVPAFGQLV